MTTDIAPGDVVEAVFGAQVSAWITLGRTYDIKVGDRAVVSGFTLVGRYSQCEQCKDTSSRGLLLVEYPLRDGVAWCFCEWRRVGPTRDEQLARFREDLGVVKSKEVVR